MVTACWPYWKVLVTFATGVVLWCVRSRTANAESRPAFGFDGCRRADTEGSRRSATQAETADQRLVTLGVLVLQVAEQTATMIHHLQEAAAGMVVLLVRLEMIGQLLDARGQQRNLYLGRPGIGRRAAVVLDDLAGLFRGKRHGSLLDRWAVLARGLCKSTAMPLHKPPPGWTEPRHGVGEPNSVTATDSWRQARPWLPTPG